MLAEIKIETRTKYKARDFHVGQRVLYVTTYGHSMYVRDCKVNKVSDITVSLSDWDAGFKIMGAQRLNPEVSHIVPWDEVKYKAMCIAEKKLGDIALEMQTTVIAAMEILHGD